MSSGYSSSAEAQRSEHAMPTPQSPDRPNKRPRVTTPTPPADPNPFIPTQPICGLPSQEWQKRCKWVAEKSLVDHANFAVARLNGIVGSLKRDLCVVVASLFDVVEKSDRKELDDYLSSLLYNMDTVRLCVPCPISDPKYVPPPAADLHAAQLFSTTLGPAGEASGIQFHMPPPPAPSTSPSSFQPVYQPAPPFATTPAPGSVVNANMFHQPPTPCGPAAATHTPLAMANQHPRLAAMATTHTPFTMANQHPGLVPVATTRMTPGATALAPLNLTSHQPSFFMDSFSTMPNHNLDPTPDTSYLDDQFPQHNSMYNAMPPTNSNETVGGSGMPLEYSTPLAGESRRE